MFENPRIALFSNVTVDFPTLFLPSETSISDHHNYVQRCRNLKVSTCRHRISMSATFFVVIFFSFTDSFFFQVASLQFFNYITGKNDVV